MTPVAALPMLVVPMAFLFVLVIILVLKAPKAGAWVIGGLVLLTLVLLTRLAGAGAFAHYERLALWVVPASFLFVLLVILMARAPKAAFGLIAAVLVMGVVGFFVAVPASHRRASQAATVEPYIPRPIEPGSAESRAMVQQRVESIQEFDRVFDGYVREPSGLVHMLPSRSGPSALSMPAPIWSDGVEEEFEADIYPSKLTATRAAGARINRSVRGLTTTTPPHLIVFQQEQDRGLIVELKEAIGRVLPQAPCTIEAERRNIGPNEVGVALYVTDIDMQPAPWAGASGAKIASGRLEVNVFASGGQTHIPKRFVEKPWVEDFATFANAKPEQHFIVARSLGTCTSESEANQQALDDARSRLTEALGRRADVPRELPAVAITTADVLNGGFVVDRFAQGFDGSAGKIWRQALLIDVSGAKLARLAQVKAHAAHAVRMTWARMGLSVVGVVVLIGMVYFFLNMATMGYYEWSLRIAGIVLAIIAAVSVLMIVR